MKFSYRSIVSLSLSATLSVTSTCLTLNPKGVCISSIDYNDKNATMIGGMCSLRSYLTHLNCFGHLCSPLLITGPLIVTAMIKVEGADWQYNVAFDWPRRRAMLYKQGNKRTGPSTCSCRYNYNHT
ncbi:hypothetical protein KEM48_006757 [Puccinia striiformis f. sp. tritici PST-130]|nr:hypothetical protein KEM48_006757 [Puccinia striiformis f. sp. tritici PST-130]